VAQGSEALNAIRLAMHDADADVSSEAISIFCGWPSVEVLPEVLTLARTAPDLKVKIVALRGAIRLIPLQDIPAQEKLAGFKALLPLITRNEEKRLLLDALSEVPSPSSLRQVQDLSQSTQLRCKVCEKSGLKVAAAIAPVYSFFSANAFSQ
jgi:hypothetical protein